MMFQRRGMLLLAAIVFAGFGVIAFPRDAGAHAFLDRSDPEANAVQPEQSAEVRLWFTEPLEPDYTSADLYNADGERVTIDASRIGDEPNLVILTLPAELPVGTYTVQWKNVSAADGHPEQGYVPFTIGTTADVITPQIPEQTEFFAAPVWLDGGGRWLALLGVTGALGTIVCWLFVLRPAAGLLDREQRDRIDTRAVNLIVIAAAVSLVGSIVSLGIQAHNTGAGLSVATLTEVLLDTRYGILWIARILLLAGMVSVATTDALWENEPPPWLVTLALVVGGAAVLPYSLNAHASALTVGRSTALAADWLHVVATSTWIGGLLALLVALIYGTRGLNGGDRRMLYAVAIGRFTTIALVSVIVLALTGVYSAWLNVGNLIALRETDYGQTLIVKLLLLVPLLVLGLLNMRVIGPRMISTARSGIHFGRTVAAEAALGVGILFAVGLLTTFPTARAVVTDEAENTTFHIFNDSTHVILYLSPGATGFNNYTIDVNVDPASITAETQLLLRFSRNVVGETVEGVREISLDHAFGQRFQGSGTELSVVGDWDAEVIFRQPGEVDERFAQSISVPRTPAVERVPGTPPLFPGWTAAVGVVFIALAILVVVVLARASQPRRGNLVELGSGIALGITGIVILLITRDDRGAIALAVNPIPSSPTSIAAGRQVYEGTCVTCHGDQGLADGPSAVGLNPPPANLTEPHVNAHPDADLYWWIENGISPNMPGSADLEETEIWNLINYVRSLGPNAAGGEP